MSLFLTLPISGQGTITDVDTGRALPSVMGDPFGFTDVFLYSHGWWTSAESAMIDYNAFSVGVWRIVLGLGGAVGHPKATSLGIGLHWPSIGGETPVNPQRGSAAHLFQPGEDGRHRRCERRLGLAAPVLTAARPTGTPPPEIHLVATASAAKWSARPSRLWPRPAC